MVQPMGVLPMIKSSFGALKSLEMVMTVMTPGTPTPTEAGIYNLPSSKGPPLEGGPMAEAQLWRSFVSGLPLVSSRSVANVLFFCPKNDRL